MQKTVTMVTVIFVMVLLARLIHEAVVRGQRDWGCIVVKRGLVVPQWGERWYFRMRKVFAAYDGGKRAHLTCTKRLRGVEGLFAAVRRSL
jgi:hypothetical protein